MRKFWDNIKMDIKVVEWVFWVLWPRDMNQWQNRGKTVMNFLFLFAPKKLRS